MIKFYDTILRLLGQWMEDMCCIAHHISMLHALKWPYLRYKDTICAYRFVKLNYWKHIDTGNWKMINLIYICICFSHSFQHIYIMSYTLIQVHTAASQLCTSCNENDSLLWQWRLQIDKYGDFLTSPCNGKYVLPMMLTQVNTYTEGLLSYVLQGDETNLWKLYLGIWKI